jgi:hypothetical protein
MLRSRPSMKEKGRSMTIGGAGLTAGLLIVLVQASACSPAKSEPPRVETAPAREESQTPAASPPAEPARPVPVEPPRTAQPKPAEPPPPRTREPSQPKQPAPAPPRPVVPAPPRPSAAVPPPPQPAAIVDLAALEKRLRDTSAIGLFTKLALKNEVDDLLERVRTFHEGRGGATLAKLRESYDLLVLKVVSLLQNKDAPLARDIFTSRETLWNLLADPVKFKTLGFAPTRGFAWRRE